jgi:hypothetical protein
VTVFPGLPRATVRQLRVPADASAVMGWLTDSDRREREWRRRVEAQEEIQESSVSRLQNGGMRFETVQVRGDLLARHVIEDVAIGEHKIDRILRGQAARRRRCSRWVVKQRITAERLGDATTVTVRMWGRPVGWSLARHLLLGSNDTTTARLLTDEASRLANFVVSGVADRFPGSEGTER